MPCPPASVAYLVNAGGYPSLLYFDATSLRYFSQPPTSNHPTNLSTLLTHSLYHHDLFKGISLSHHVPSLVSVPFATLKGYRLTVISPGGEPRLFTIMNPGNPDLNLCNAL